MFGSKKIIKSDGRLHILTYEDLCKILESYGAKISSDRIIYNCKIHSLIILNDGKIIECHKDNKNIEQREMISIEKYNFTQCLAFFEDYINNNKHEIVNKIIDKDEDYDW